MLQWLKNKTTLSILMLLVISIWGCQGKVPPMEFFPDMQDSFAVESQEADYSAPQKSGSRIPPEGTLARNYYPYPFKKVAIAEDLQGDTKGLPNPISKSEEAFKRGEQRFHIYCYPCHGARGEGNGPVIGPEPRFTNPPPSLLTDRVKGWTDGQIYHTITMGRGQMSSYAYQVEPEDRWKIIHYIRLLQSSGGK